jgi:hypothetical protein
MDKEEKLVNEFINRMIMLVQKELEMFDIHILERACHKGKLAKGGNSWRNLNTLISVNYSHGKKIGAKDAMAKKPLSKTMNKKK